MFMLVHEFPGWGYGGARSLVSGGNADKNEAITNSLYYQQSLLYTCLQYFIIAKYQEDFIN